MKWNLIILLYLLKSCLLKKNLEKENVFYEVKTEIYSKGFNSKRYKYNNKKMTIHAEIDALKKLKYKMKIDNLKVITTDLVVIRFRKDLTLGESGPCKHCIDELSKEKKILK